MNRQLLASQHPVEPSPQEESIANVIVTTNSTIRRISERLEKIETTLLGNAQVRCKKESDGPMSISGILCDMRSELWEIEERVQVLNQRISGE